MISHRPHTINRYGSALALLIGLLSGSTPAIPAQDLTELSLEELMDMELPASAPSARFQVSATAVNSCNLSATDLTFGNYDPLKASPTDASSLVTITCTAGSGYIIGLDAGIGQGATVETRRLANGEHQLNYSLYRDATRNLVWGNSPGTDTSAGVGTGMPIDYPVYGRIPQGQTVPRGVYTDTVTVSVSF